MEKLRLYKFRSINDYETAKLDLEECSYFEFLFDEKYYKEERERGEDFVETVAFPPDSFWGEKSKLPFEEPILFVTNDVRDEHQLDESIPDEYKANMEIPSLWKMPLIENLHRCWIVRNDLFEAICEAITVGEYTTHEAQIYCSHLNKTFTNYKIIHILNIEPNMEESEYEMSKYYKVPTPEFRKMKFNKTDFKEVIASEHLISGPLVTEEFKNKLEGFSKELCFEYMDYDNSDLDFNVYC